MPYAMRIIGLALSVSLTACSLHQVREFDRPAVTIPETYQHAQVGEQALGSWWEAFGDARLNTAIERAMADNLEVRQAWRRLDQARALAQIEQADRWPRLSIETGVAGTRTVDRDARDALGNETTQRDTRGSYFITNGLSYEVDLWQRIASQSQAARLELGATRQDLEATVLVLTGAITEVWFTIQEQQALLALLQEQVAVSKTLLDLAELRFSLGQGSAVEVLQQRQQVTATEAEVPLAEVLRQTSLYQLAVLVGQPPGHLNGLAPNSPLPHLPAFPRLATPGALLTRRPDLQAARLRLQAADYDVGVAVADLLPRLRISLSYEFSALDAASLFSREVGSIVGNLLSPIFEGGRRRSEVTRRRAMVQEQLDRFGQTYLTALREVEDALVRERHQLDFLERLDKQIALAEMTLDEAQSRYVNGLSDYLTVLIAVQSLQEVQRRRLSAQQDLLVIRAELYRALGGGGGWLDQLAPPQAQVHIMQEILT